MEWFLLVLFLLLSGFFSGAEIALFSVGPERINALKQNTRNRHILRQIAQLEALKANKQRLLVSILVGNNLVNVGASALATVMATRLASDWGMVQSEALVLGSVTGVMTLLLLIFGEITPKSLAHHHAIKFSLWIAPILSLWQWFLTPVSWPLSQLVKRLSPREETAKHGLTEDELKAALELSEQEGKIDTDEKRWVEKIFDFGEHTVENVMTPRSKIFAFPDDTPIPKALESIRIQKFSRIPVYHEDLDEINGTLSVHGIIEKMSESEFLGQKVANLPLNKPFKIPVTMKIDRLLRSFQEEQTHMAFVYDEHGGLVGLITLEDVLEEIFGEIQDEQDEDVQIIHQNGKSRFVVSSEAELEQFANFATEKLELSEDFDWPWSLEDENKSWGLFLLEQFEKFPETGEKILLGEEDQVRCGCEILKCEDDQILSIQIELKI